jgi:hypothetical protein
MTNRSASTADGPRGRIVRRDVLDQPVSVQEDAGRPVRIRSYGLITDYRSSHRLGRPGTDVELWHVVCLDDDGATRVYDLERDHDAWRITAVWS